MPRFYEEVSHLKQRRFHLWRVSYQGQCRKPGVCSPFELIYFGGAWWADPNCRIGRRGLSLIWSVVYIDHGRKCTRLRMTTAMSTFAHVPEVAIERNWRDFSNLRYVRMAATALPAKTNQNRNPSNGPGMTSHIQPYDLNGAIVLRIRHAGVPKHGLVGFMSRENLEIIKCSTRTATSTSSSEPKAAGDSPSHGS